MKQKKSIKIHLEHKNNQAEMSLGNEMSDNAKKIYEIVKLNKYKGIIVYFHAVHFEPMQRPQHMLREFAKEEYLCFFCEEYNEENELLIKYEENLYVINGENELISALRNETGVISYITYGLQYYSTKYLNEAKIWYDIVDEPSFFSHYDFLKKIYKKLAIEAEIVTYTATELKRFSKGSKKCIFLPNAVNTEDFSNVDSNFTNKHIEKIKKIKEKNKIIGYFGAVESWFDLSIINKISQNIQNVKIVIIGEVNIDISSVDKSKVYFLCKVKYSELVNYAKHFDIGIIPFKKSKITNSVSPVKFFEYLSLGMPCVSTDILEMKNYKDEKGVYVAKNSNEFLKYIKEALEADYKKEDILKFAIKNTWKNRADKLIGIFKGD